MMSTALDFRVLFDAIASPHMVLDRDLRFVAANSAYLKTTSRSLDSLLGTHVMEAFPDEGESGRRLIGSFRKVLASGEPDTLAFLPYAIAKPESEGGGFSFRYWTCVHTPILDATGATSHIVQNTVDVTELVDVPSDNAQHRLSVIAGSTALLQRTRELQSQHERISADSANFQRLFQRAPGMIAVLWGPEHTFRFANDAYGKLVGRDVVGLPIREALPDIEGQGFYEMLDEVFRTGRPYHGTNRRVMLQEDPRLPPRETFLDYAYDPITDEDGVVTGILVQAADRTESVRAMNHQRVLLDELNHRVKNTLSTVQSIAAQTLRQSSDVVAARAAFEARIMALSHAHDLLSLSNWSGADLGAIIERELAPFGAQRIRLQGPEIRLPPPCTVPLGMMLHELMSNASRHGALSRPEGLVSVTWTIEPVTEGRKSRLHLAWREQGGPLVTPPRRRGFGARLIAMAVQGELNGKADLNFDPSGVRCDISIPFAMDGMAHG